MAGASVSKMMPTTDALQAASQILSMEGGTASLNGVELSGFSMGGLSGLGGFDFLPGEGIPTDLVDTFVDANGIRNFVFMPEDLLAGGPLGGLDGAFGVALDFISYGLIGLDLVLGGPTGEGIVPAMAIGAFRLGSRQAAKQAAKEAFRKEAGDLPKRILRDSRAGGTGRIKGVGAGKASYRPKLDGSYSVTRQSGRAKDTLHFRP